MSATTSVTSPQLIASAAESFRFCDIHSNMTGFVYVTETPWVAQPDDKGRFVLDGLPDGTYTLEMWHPERGTRTQSVTVTAAGTHLELVF